MELVLIIEDDPICANLYRMGFQKAGFEVLMATDGEEGVDKIYASRPHAVLLDIMLPRIKGVDVLRTIRGVSEFESLPIIVFTNAFLPATVEEAHQAGATVVLNKSSTKLDLVVGAVRSAIQRVQESEPRPASVDEESASSKQPQAEAPDSSQRIIADQFTSRIPAAVRELGYYLEKLKGSYNDHDRFFNLSSVYSGVRRLAGEAALVGMWNMAAFGAALEVLVSTLINKESKISNSIHRTLGASIQFFLQLKDAEKPFQPQSKVGANLLILDGETAANSKNAKALETANLKSISAFDLNRAIEILDGAQIHTIILDGDLANGETLKFYQRLRQKRGHETTPVIFVTRGETLDNTISQQMADRDDYMAKPFPPFELTVKALLAVMRHNLTKAS